MKTPSRIEPLVADGLVDRVMRQLMSGKEAMADVVQCGDALHSAKVYKAASKRGFHKAVELTGVVAADDAPADLGEVMQVIEAARREEAARQAGRAAVGTD